MKLRITALFRKDAYTHDFSLPPSRDNPGGGLAKKAHQTAAALPVIQWTSDIAELGEIVLVEPLWFSSRIEDGEDFLEVLGKRANAYAAHRGYKILWTSDFDCFRWPSYIREQIFEATDVVCGNSPYMVDVLKAFATDVALLTDPFDVDMVVPTVKKKPIIYSCSQVIAEKRVFTITDIYRGLPVDLPLQTGFIGSSHVWGIEGHNDPETARLEADLDATCDWVIKAANMEKVHAHAVANWGYVCDAGMETFGYGLAEAMAGGAQCFCGQHLAYAKPVRPVRYFTDVADAVEMITNMLNASDLMPLDAPRQWVYENCGFDVFRSQFWDIVGGAYAVN